MSFPAESRTEYWNVVVAAMSSCLSTAAGEPLEVLDVVALLDAGLVADLADLHELGQVLIHRVHAVLRACLQRAVDLVGLALADQVADGRCRDKTPSCDRAPWPI